MFPYLVLIDSNDAEDRLKLEFRNAAMNCVFSEVDSKQLAYSDKCLNGDIAFVCHWEGVKCVSEEIYSLKYHDFRYGNFNLSFLPHSTRAIDIVYCAQDFFIDIRGLPRLLTEISLRSNSVKGSVDLTSLPVNVVSVNFWGNRLRGPISLMKLPKFLRFLDLSCNEISQEIVYYENLPEKIERIAFTPKPNGPAVREVQAVASDESNRSHKKIFHGVKVIH